MTEWILDNKQWLFSGLALFAIGGIWKLLIWGKNRWSEGRSASHGVDAAGLFKQPEYETVFLKGHVMSLPSQLLRLFLKPEKVAESVHIELRGNTPFSIVLNSEIPRIEIYFDITNMSKVDLILDRMLIDFWFAQPTFSGVLLQRYRIPSGQIIKNIHYRHELNEYQNQRIEKFMSPETLHQPIYIYLTAYFESRIGRIEVRKTIERSKI